MFPEAVAAMAELLALPGNPSSLHASGRLSRRHVEEARETVARVLGARAGEVVFTAGGTEADNIGLKGLAWSEREINPAKRRVVVSAIEHHAILDPAEWLNESDDFALTLVAVDEFGRVTPEALRSALGDDPSDVAVVSVMLANNEVGTVNDIAALTAVTREFGIRFHTDAVQAPAWFNLRFSDLGVCAMTVSGHKVGGPHGVGALIISRDCNVTPLVHGGGQERDVRSGTLDTPAIVAFAKALEIVEQRRDVEVARVSALRDELVACVQEIAPDAVYNGHLTERLANNAHFTFPGCLGDSLLMLLDAQGVECSVGSACSAGVPQPSHVLLAMGASDNDARSTLRFTLGYSSTQADVDALIAALPSALERGRRAGMPKS
jgi:cysteine desulfurase